MDLVSIIMPLYNTPYDYFRCAVNSIMEQTYSRFELLIINDGSTEYNDLDIWNSIIENDPRVKIINNEHRKGVAGALNTGIEHSSGKYIFRMDSDDFSLPDRIMKQVNYMDEHQDVDLLAGYIQCFGASNKKRKSEKNNVAIKTVLLFQCGISHPSICLRKSTIDKHKLCYSENVQSEDYDLWTRCAIIEDFVFSTLPIVVLKYRVHENQVSNIRKNTMIQQGQRIRFDYISNQVKTLENNDIQYFIDFSMYLCSDINCKKLISIERKLCHDFALRYCYRENKTCKKTFWKICSKKALSYCFKGHFNMFLVFLVNVFYFAFC